MGDMILLGRCFGSVEYNKYIAMSKKEVWITDNSNPKYQRIKASFLEIMHQQTKETKINYYDFLLVAKKLSFRFEESSHLMALKNYFAKNKNQVLIKKIADLLCISQESIHAQEEKIIVKFTVPDTEFAPIKEETHEDEEEQDDSLEIDNEYFEKMGGDLSQEEQRQINEKMAIILTIKVDEMEKKIRTLTGQQADLCELAHELGKPDLVYDQFKGVVVSILGQLKQKVKISEDDIKTIFYILDTEKKNSITLTELEDLRNISTVTQKLKEFYRSRINRDMVKNTLFKLGKVKNNSIQIYQVKNASLLEFQNIQKSIVEEVDHSKAFSRTKQAKIPHFGPLKGAALANKQRQSASTQQHAHPKGSESQIRFERERIEKILRLSKQQKRKDKKGDTVASKLRSLFIHKVILPRQKMLEQQKERYLKHKGVESDLAIRPHR